MVSDPFSVLTLNPTTQFWAALAFFLIVLLPAVVPHKRRRGYAALLCATAALVLAVSWAFPRPSYIGLDAVYNFVGARSTDCLTLRFDVTRCGLGFGFADTHDESEHRELHLGQKPELGIVDNPHVEFPAWSAFPSFQRWGFVCFSVGHGHRGPATIRNWTLFFAPKWCFIAVLAVIPTAYLRRSSRLRRRQLRAQGGLCVECGYDLRSHKPGDKCPECGTPKPAPPANSKLRVATETQGKPA